MTESKVPFKKTFFPSAAMHLERRADGSLLVTPKLPLENYISNIPAELVRRAVLHPDKTYLAERPSPEAPWRKHSYADTRRDSEAIAQWLLTQKFPVGRSLLILSGNSIAHATIKYGAMAARIPACPVSTNYGLMGGDFGRLRHVIQLIRPAVVFAEQAILYKRALETLNLGDALVITDEPHILDRPAVAFSEVLATQVTSAVSNSIATLSPDEHSLYMLTSGSTSLPKAVIQTQRMLCSNIAQARQVLGDTAGWSDVMLDWLPWSHVSGAFTKMGTLVSGGTLYIDGGRPIPGKFSESLRNLKEITPKFYVNVPFGYAMFADALDLDLELRQRFFSNIRLCLYGGAGLPQALYERFQQLAIDTIGERVFFTTGYGATETASGCMAIYFQTEVVGIGLPMPGLTMKLVPNADRYEVRLKGPMITPGYLAKPEANLEIFDEEGFYRTGDAAQLHDANDIGQGLKFAGRLAEEFKLSTGTWVSAGRLRAELLEAFTPFISDFVICGENADQVALLAWPKNSSVTPPERAELGKILGRFNIGRGASERIKCLLLLNDPPSVDHHEVSDKGSINQRVALVRRTAQVARLYSSVLDYEIITPTSD